MSQTRLFGRMELLRLSAIIVFATAFRAGAADATRSLTDLSLEDLLKIEVTSVARRAQPVADAMSAVYVITNEDIRRSGVRHVADALALAPGVEVRRISDKNWAVTIRGFNGRFANKLLVLRDGRSVYSQLFSGVFWEGEDTILEDIDRIEIIRGPQAALWGANAVNGVINIITKPADRTQGTLVEAAAGTSLDGDLALRHGGRLDADTSYRVYTRGFREQASGETTGAQANDAWRARLIGFRVDGARPNGDRFALHGEHHATRSGETLFQPSFAAPYSNRLDTQLNRYNANLTGRYEWLRPDGNDASMRVSYDRSDLDLIGYLAERRDTLDIDAQQRIRLGMHDLIGGLAYRTTHDETVGTTYVSLHPSRRTLSLASAFLHDEIALVPDQVRMILGARFEHHTYTGFAAQPNARWHWQIDATQSAWAAASRAVRTPSRAENNADGFVSVIGPTSTVPLPTVIRARGEEQLNNERVDALEMGYRTQWSARTSTDITVFQNRYKGLQLFVPGTATLVAGASPYLLVVSESRNAVDAQTRGWEWVWEWKPYAWWRLGGAYSRLLIDIPHDPDPTADAFRAGYRKSGAAHKLTLRSSTDLGAKTSFDLWARYLSRSGTIGGFTVLDARLAYRLSKSVDLELIGRNLLDPRHSEATTDFLTEPVYELRRSALARVTWRF